ncbi:succinyldiaminopimelate transaminase [Bifidobacterium gallicum]|uniref:N-succinyldiaminopimelate aminotransferase n=1 Tax=Bifidobacterium gallicum DSM 20093 = LMG 11596 TaxID=561180 RepID=D1NVF8_9BIFI|nr:succinyldiaminopimelate transaminase [Bifidobacterium gallicum]EFA22809.1 succinyldiaminopimelate transaminase [Bifidobacterium gallicum DSM 20093 = LMG 11596]KFI59743.1 N-succinyldiaminopimelate aminotransferase [Bifidobacterium gallicum DSM 20093 = LMG 11596]
MGFEQFSSPYDWSRIAQYRRTAQAAAGGMIDLSVGSPVDPVPDSVRKALAAASADPNAHGYPLTIGTPQLREALHTWFRDCRDVPDLEAIGASVVPTVGSKEAVALMASLLGLGHGDVVVQPRVSYPTYEIGTQIAGATVLKVDDVADVDSWVHEPHVKAIWVNSPNNPTGRVLDAAALARIVDAARSIDAVVLSDECYALMDWSRASREAVAHDQPFVSSPCALRHDVCSDSARNVLVLYSLSKQSNMAGYRTAAIAGDAEIIKTMTQLRKQIGQIIPGPVQAAMAAGLGDVAAVRTQYERYRQRLGTLVQGLRAYGYAADMPQGALYVWVRAKSGDCWSDMAALAQIGIIASPGEFYGAPEYLRFSATAIDEQIEQASQRLAR